MNSQTVTIAISFVIGAILGYSVTSGHYKDQMLSDAEEYKKQVQEAKAKELHWYNYAIELDNEYKEKLNSVKSNNDALIARLRQQLNATSGMSSNCQSSVQSNGNTRGTRVSEEINSLIDFADRCSQRADQLIIQLSSLQDWIKSVK